MLEIVAEDLAPKKSYSDLVLNARDDQVCAVRGLLVDASMLLCREALSRIV